VDFILDSIQEIESSAIDATLQADTTRILIRSNGNLRVGAETLLNPAVILLFQDQIKHLAQAGVRPSDVHIQGSPMGSPGSFIMHTDSLIDCNHGSGATLKLI
jgi:hypothetical protein